MNARTRLAVAVIALAIISSASAQPPSAGRFGHAAGCVRENASRLPSANDCGAAPSEQIVITHELEVTNTVSTPEIVINDCQADISLEYSQRGTLARVKGLIDSQSCPASTGTFVVAVRTANSNGEIITQEFPETWQSNDGQPLIFDAEYAIGDNVDLQRVRSLRARCTCITPE